jgi:CHAT domain-containing protein
MLIIGGLDYDDMGVVETDTIVTANREAADYLCKYMGGAGSYFQYLSGTKAEVDTISAILNQPTLKYKVSESSIKELLPQFNIVHVATHGYCLDLGIRKQPEYLADSIPYDKSLIASGLVLSGANKAITRTFGEDEILSARELCDLDLSDVDFVVLSACETAKGDISDEGAAGIVRGLKNAGVKTILASLWSVDDKSTALFMQEFYKRLGCGESRFQSFIAAQEYLRNYREEIEYRKFSAKTLAKDKNIHKITISYNTPYYWAPFILIDEY